MCIKANRVMMSDFNQAHRECISVNQINLLFDQMQLKMLLFINYSTSDIYNDVQLGFERFLFWLHSFDPYKNTLIVSNNITLVFSYTMIAVDYHIHIP